MHFSEEKNETSDGVDMAGRNNRPRIAKAADEKTLARSFAFFFLSAFPLPTVPSFGV
jgi:hypothetical protein